LLNKCEPQKCPSFENGCLSSRFSVCMTARRAACCNFNLLVLAAAAGVDVDDDAAILFILDVQWCTLLVHDPGASKLPEGGASLAAHQPWQMRGFSG